MSPSGRNAGHGPQGNETCGNTDHDPLGNSSLVISRSRKATGISLDRAKWACLDAVMCLAVQCTAEGGALGSGAERQPLPPASSPGRGGGPGLALRPDLCRSLLAEALDVLQYCLESETVVVLRVLRRCWCQLIWEGHEEQVRIGVGCGGQD